MGYSTKFISYDLKAPNKDYEKLYKYLRSFSGVHKIQESFWMINSDKSAAEIRDELEVYTDSNDSIFVSSYGDNSTSAWRNVSENIKSDLAHEPR